MPPAPKWPTTASITWSLVLRMRLKMSGAEQFDAIAITASVPELDGHFMRMLRPEGRLFAVVGRAPAMEARLITMHAERPLEPGESVRDRDRPR